MSFSTPGHSEPLTAHKRTRRDPAPDYQPEDPMLTAREGAAELRLGLSTFWRDVKVGRLPAPYYVTPRCPRWRRSELRAAATRNRKPQS